MPFIPIPPTGTTAEKIEDMVAAMIADPIFSVQTGYDFIVISALQQWADETYSTEGLFFVVSWSLPTSYRFTLPVTF